MKKLLSVFFAFMFLSINAQEHTASLKYTLPADKLVQAKLSQWGKIKFGLLMHWGTYSQWGVVESWSLCPEDEGWTVRKGPYAMDWYTYKQAYENLQTTFNPVKFNPEKWALAAKNAGMKYVVFTTKHHDGFNMFDTKQSDYKITGTKSPFANNPKANVAKEIFNAFRDQGFMTGAYFSKPDWNTPDYWWKYFPPKDRNVSYDPKKYPEKWESFKKFTYNQIEELMSDYGKMDILWLDGGWVRPFSSVDTSVEWQRTITHNQDIDMANIARMARTHQPGLLVVDRTVHGEYENYVTPEQQVPATYLPYPWESCMTLGNSWSYVPNDEYKSSRKVIHLLTEIVSKNGNLLLNIGPAPDGEWDPNAYARLEDIGKWMQVNGEAIYDAEADASLPGQGKWVFTKKQDCIYAIYQLAAKEAISEIYKLNINTASPIKKIQILGTDQKIIFKQASTSLSIFTPVKKLNANTEALVFKIQY
ncbi:MAG: alpha-L-fucosidase [Chitinophagia bacterium]|jgi:alpha-L-fucosidase|nr:alpha-L-fucosidase [Chitinophagia bacterium]